VVELELFQSRERPVPLLGERDPLLLTLGREVERVVHRPRVSQERPGHEEHAEHCEQHAEREPHQVFLGVYFEGHFVTSESRFATKTPCV
jgi:hypothetical protein